MDILIAQAAKQAGASFPFEASETLMPQRFGRRTIRFAEPLRVSGSVTFDGGAYMVRARAETAMASVCARCNRAFTEPYTFLLTERFVRDGVEEGESYPYTGEHLLLDQALMDNLFLHLPIVSLCAPTCKGLCPVCGCDHNLRRCACDIPEKEKPFSVLSSLMDGSLEEELHKEELKEV